jgi:sensor domain CHASE-containing protein
METGKTSKYFKYAIGEIILVVIGILIALQINNWNEKRKARISEKLNLTQLLEDFNTNKVAIKQYLERYEENRKDIEVTLRNTGPNAQIPSPKTFDSIVSFWYPSVQLLYTKPSTIAGLSLNLISSINLKKQISTLPLAYANYEKTERIIEELTLEQRKIHQKYMPLIAEEPGYKQNRFDSDSMGLLRDRQLQNATVDKFWNVKSAAWSLEYIEKHNDSIISLLKIELDKLSN